MAKKRKVTAATRHARAKKIGLALMGGYDAQLAKQGGGCAICGQAPKVRKLNIDHDHLTMAPRGLLCHACNRGLAWFRDNPTRMMAAVRYLQAGWREATAIRDAKFT